MINFLKHSTRHILQFLGILSSVRKFRTKVDFLLGKGYFVPVAVSLPTVYLGSDRAGYSIFPAQLNSESILY